VLLTGMASDCGELAADSFVFQAPAHGATTAQEVLMAVPL